MAYIGMAYTVMAYIVMAFNATAHVVMAYIVTTYTVMAYIVIARSRRSRARASCSLRAADRTRWP